MRIIFAGTPDFAASALNRLLQESFDICAVYTQPDRKSGRGQKVQASPVKQLALAHHIPVEQPIHFKEPSAIEQLQSYNADLMIVAAYGLLLPEAVLNTPKRGCINIHASLLPRWRGAAPIQRAIQTGDNATGITIMQMDIGLDTGDMLFKKDLILAPNETGGSLHDKLSVLGADAIVEALQQFESLQPISQQNEDATYAKKLSKQEARIDWSDDARAIERQIRAFNPWPVCFSEIETHTIRIFNAHIVHDVMSHPPGTIIEFTKTHLRVACGIGALDIVKLQLPGGKPLSASDLFNSKRTFFEGKCFN